MENLLYLLALASPLPLLVVLYFLLDAYVKHAKSKRIPNDPSHFFLPNIVPSPYKGLDLNKRLGMWVYRKVLTIWQLIVLFFQIMRRMHLVVKNPDLLLDQMVKIGLNSIPLLAITSLFTGMVAAVQAKFQFRNFVPDKFVGTAAIKMILIELGPVLTGLVLAGRVGSALAAEIASMKEKEEIDAMKTLGLDPLRYLAAPRMLSTMLMVPALTILSIMISALGAYLVSLYALNLTAHTFLTGVRYFYDPRDIIGALLKAFVFGIVVCLMGYYRGIHAETGSKGVGYATMKVVVSSCVLILFFDFVITLLVF